MVLACRVFLVDEARFFDARIVHHPSNDDLGLGQIGRMYHEQLLELGLIQLCRARTHREQQRDIRLLEVFRNDDGAWCSEARHQQYLIAVDKLPRRSQCPRRLVAIVFN